VEDWRGDVGCIGSAKLSELARRVGWRQMGIDQRVVAGGMAQSKRGWSPSPGRRRSNEASKLRPRSSLLARPACDAMILRRRLSRSLRLPFQRRDYWRQRVRRRNPDWQVRIDFAEPHSRS